MTGPYATAVMTAVRQSIGDCYTAWLPDDLRKSAQIAVIPSDHRDYYAMQWYSSVPGTARLMAEALS